MKAAYLLAAGVAVVCLWKRRYPAPAASRAMVQVGSLGEGAIVDGSNWTGDAWSRMWDASSDLAVPGGANLGGYVNADPGKVGRRTLGLAPGWNGSL